MILIKRHIARFVLFALAILAALPGVAQRNKKDLYSQKYIREIMEKVCTWQLANPVSFNAKNDNDWARAAFYTGVMATYRTTGN